jgi:hypothetical protein
MFGGPVKPYTFGLTGGLVRCRAQGLSGMAMKVSYVVGVALFVIFCGARPANAESTFAFESVTTLDEMSSLVRTTFPLGTSRSTLRHAFVDEGRATLKVKADDPGVEKYIYDIDLCHYYVWRWNISADYDASGKLRQAYVNGDIVFPGGTPKNAPSKVAEDATKASIVWAQRPRPEAYKGENSLGFLLYDRDGDQRTANDQSLIGAGPSRAHPSNMGKLTTYTDVDPWRSIFDFDAADRIVPFNGDCSEVDRLMQSRNAAETMKPNPSVISPPQLWSDHKRLNIPLRACADLAFNVMNNLGYSNVVRNGNYSYGNFEQNRAAVKCVEIAEGSFVYFAVAGAQKEVVERLRNQIAGKL